LAWTIKRLVISAFVAAHLAAVTIWIVPQCELKRRCFHTLAYYMLPIGQWQYWGMFAPDPVKNTIWLEAIARDAKGMLHSFAFPKEQDMPTFLKIVRYRHSKYATNFAAGDEFKAHREFGARHVVRSLNLPADAFPVDVEMVFQVRVTPPLGTVPDPMAPVVPSTIESYRFPTLEEVLP
jgi:hypothetical protein